MSSEVLIKYLMWAVFFVLILAGVYSLLKSTGIV